MDALPVMDYVLVLDYLLLKYELPNILLVLDDEPNKEESLLEDDLPKIKKKNKKIIMKFSIFFFISRLFRPSNIMKFFLF